MQKLLELVQKNLTVVLVLVVILLVGGGFGLYKSLSGEDCVPSEEETDITFDPEGIYALLLPRSDGNALNLNLKRTGQYSSISYELAYRAASDSVANVTPTGDGESGMTSDQGIDRGVVGDIKVDKKAPEYNQEILFGTCSKNVCKYDKGVENGTLTVHLTGDCGKQRMATSWRIQNLDIALGKITSGDNHFIYQVASDSAKTAEENRNELVRVGYSIVNEVTSVPKLPNGKTVFEKVYTLNVPEAKTLSKGDVMIETADNIPGNAKLGLYIDEKNDWQILESKVEGSKITAMAPQDGIFAILIDKP
jgi:hypothetical protein